MRVIPTPLRSELLSQLFLRCARVNGFQTGTSFAAHVAGKKPAASSLKASRSYLIASLLERIYSKPIEYFIRHHSTIPYQQAFLDPRQRTGLSFSSANKDFGFLSVSQQPRFCRTCLAEDIEEFGFSYFRTKDQVIGDDRCDRHDTALSLAAVDPTSTLPSDRAFLTHAEDNFEEGQLAVSFSNEFRIVTRWLLHAPVLVKTAVISARLCALAKSQGIPVKYPSAGRGAYTFGFSIENRHDEAAIWIKRIMKRCSSPRNTSIAYRLDRALYGNECYSTAMIICALVITGSADVTKTLLSSASPSNHDADRLTSKITAASDATR